MPSKKTYKVMQCYDKELKSIISEYNRKIVSFTSKVKEKDYNKLRFEKWTIHEKFTKMSRFQSED